MPLLAREFGSKLVLFLMLSVPVDWVPYPCVVDKAAKKAARTPADQNLPPRGMDRPQAQNHFIPTVAGADLTGKKQLRPLVKEWLARTQDYARGEASLHHLWTTIDGVDPEASMRHFPRKGGGQ